MIAKIAGGLLILLTGTAFCQLSGVTKKNEEVTSSAEAERRVMEETFGEVLALAGKDSKRGKMFRKAQNEWIKYVKQQAEADADGVSGEARYPQSYYQTLRELTRYRTRALEGCLSRLRAENVGNRGEVASRNENGEGSGANTAARDWKNEVGDEPLATETTFYVAEIEGVSGVLGGQWQGDELWRGIFIADRGDGMTLYGGKLEKGGIVFEAWQEKTRIGRGFIRDEEGTLRGRFFDERRRETPLVLREQKAPKPVGYKVGLTSYTGLIGTEEGAISLEWHDTHFVRGERAGGARLLGDNFDSGRLFLSELDGEGEDAKVLAYWNMTKSTSGGSTRWLGQRKGVDGSQVAVEFGR